MPSLPILGVLAAIAFALVMVAAAMLLPPTAMACRDPAASPHCRVAQ